MADHVMHPSAEIYGEQYARESFVKVEYHVGGPLNAIWFHVFEADTGDRAFLEIPKATFDRFIAEYLSAHGETWIG